MLPLTLLSLIPGVLVMAFIMLIAPGVLLLLAPNIFVLAVATLPARLLWAGTSRVIPTLIACAIGLSTVYLGPSVVADDRRAATLAKYTVPEIAPVRIGGSVQRVLYSEDASTNCADECQRLLLAGVDTVVMPERVRKDLRGRFPLEDRGATFKLAHGDACSQEISRCVIRNQTTDLTADLIILTSKRVELSSEEVRYNPLSHGQLRIDRAEAWSCLEKSACILVARHNQVRSERLWPVLVMGLDNANYELYMWRGWQRYPAVLQGDADPIRMASVLLGRDIPKAPFKPLPVLFADRDND